MEANGIRVSSDAFMRRIVEGMQTKQLRTKKLLKTLAFNLTLVKESRCLIINGITRQSSLAYPHNFKIGKDTEFLGIRKPIDGRFNQASSLYWYVLSLSFQFLWHTICSKFLEFVKTMYV